MQLSVIIPVYNRVAPLRRTLQALKNQSLSSTEFEIFVVDDGSTAQTSIEIATLCAKFNCQLAANSHKGLAGARNAGVEHAMGDYVLFLDDDVMPGQNALEEHLKAHRSQEKDVAVVGSLPFSHHVDVNAFTWFLDRSGHYDLFKNPGKYKQGKPPIAAMNGNSSISRQCFKKSGGYDVKFSTYGSEDLDLGYRLQMAGVQFVYAHLAVGYHNHSKDFQQFLIDMESAGDALAHLGAKFPEIKKSKKIDLVADPYSSLSFRGKVIKLILEILFICPWMISLTTGFIKITGHLYMLRYFLYPLYIFVRNFYYAKGIKKGIRALL